MEKSSKSVAFATFAGHNSTKMSWMSVDRLINSSWNDVMEYSTANPVSFTVKGRYCLWVLPVLTKRTDVLPSNLQSLDAARLGVVTIISLWNLTGISAAQLSRCLSDSRTIEKIWIRISRRRDFNGSCGKTSVHLVNIGHAWLGHRSVGMPLWQPSQPVLCLHTVF